VGWASVEEIDAVNILNATRLAMERALAGMGIPPERLLLDALRLPRVACEQVAIIHGDARCLSIAAASVLAKTARDTLLGELDRQYPGYGFAEHKGYGTLRHRQALEQLGPCPAHRLSFAPLRERLAEQSG
jgi:ribonuclease HII